MNALYTLLISGLIMLTSSNSFAQPATPDICLVTVDLNSTYNIIYWDKTSYTDADYFIVYRVNSFGSYDSIATVPFDSLSEYTDLTFDPNVSNTRYKLAVRDTLGAISSMSNYHQTMYCGEPVTGQFNWNDYSIESTSPISTSFVMLRQDSTGLPWVAIDTIPTSTLNFTDIDSALFPAGSWRVKILTGTTCNPTRAGVSTSRSNIRSRTPSISNGVQQINLSNSFVVYPNPAYDLVSILYLGNDEIQNIYITNLFGQTVYTQQYNSSRMNVDTKNFSVGVYNVHIITTKGQAIKRFIKE